MRIRWLIILMILIIGAGAGFWWRQTVLQQRAERIAKNARAEKTITIIPGWDLRDIARYLVREGFAAAEADVYAVTGEPAKRTNKLVTTASSLLAGRLDGVSFEGYLAPNTYRVYATASVADIIGVLEGQREKEFTPDLKKTITGQGRTIHQILTLASILEKEVRAKEDKAKVSDIFWRRHDVGMGLQADSTVHYVVGKEGDVFTSAEDRAVKNLWNTYQYPKLPPGPISNPSLDSIMAAVKPNPNDYWYFLTTLDTGEVKYARTLTEHNENVRKFLKK